MKHFTLFKTTLMLCLMMVGLSAWAEVASGNKYSTPSNSNMPSGWTCSVGGGTTYVQLTASTHFILTDEFTQGGITSIKIKARKYGGPSDAQAKITASWVVGSTTQELGSVTPSSTTLTDYTISSINQSITGTGKIKIECKSASSSKGSGVSEVTITYKSGAVNTYTLTFASNSNGSFSAKVDGNTVTSGSKVEAGKTVTLTAEPKDGYVFNAWNVYKTANQYNYVTVSNVNTFTMPSEAVTVDAYFVEGKTIPNAQVSVAAGTYRGEQSVTITNLDESEYSYYYTLDGSTPEIDEGMNLVGTTQEYTGAINITESCTLSILTTDLEDSKVNTFEYVIEYPYTVTIVEPENGTLTVMYGETPVKSGDKFYKGDVISVTATPATGYKYRNIVITDGSTHTFPTDNKVWNMGDHDITIKANFDEIQYYTVAFSVNGTTVQSDKLEENTAISAPAVSDINGKKFMGWVKSTVVIDPENAPTYEVITKATEDVTYVAVFATQTGEASLTTATLNTSGKDTAGYSKGTQDDSEENTWNYYAAINNQSGTLCFGLNTNANNYNIASPDFGQNITSIKIKGYNGSSTTDRKLMICSSNETAQPTTGDLAEVTIKKSERFTTTYEVDLSQAGNFSQFYIYAAAALGVSEVNVTYGSPATYSNFTTNPAAPVNITVTAAGYSTYYNSEAAYVMPEGMEGYVWNGGLVMQYEANEIVPAGTGLVLKASESKYTLNFTTGGNAPEHNDLMGTDEETTLDADDECYFYGLSKGKAGSENAGKVGFYWMATDGAAFTNGAHKAYLKLAKTAGAKSYIFDLFNEDTEDAIKVVDASSTEQVYDLAGRRVSKATKGIFIVNGKKVIR